MPRLTKEEQAHELRSLADDITENLNRLYLLFCESAYNSGDLPRLKSLHGYLVRAIQANDQPSKGFIDE